MPDGTSRFSIGKTRSTLITCGCSTFANYTVLPEIAVAKVREDAPFDKICYIGCGVTTASARSFNNTAQGDGCHGHRLRASAASAST